VPVGFGGGGGGGGWACSLAFGGPEGGRPTPGGSGGIGGGMGAD
jgi:hypothetical protein